MAKTNKQDPNESAAEWWAEPGLPDVIADIGRWMGGRVGPPQLQGTRTGLRRRWVNGDRYIVHNERDDLVVNLVTSSPKGSVQPAESSAVYVGTEETARDIFKWLETGVLPDGED